MPQCDNNDCKVHVNYDDPPAEIIFKEHGSIRSEFVYCCKECAAEDLKSLDVGGFE